MLFNKKTCTKCGYEYDCMERRCPQCEEPDNDKERYRKLDNLTWLSYPRELVVFLVGFLLFEALGSIIYMFFGNSTWSDEGISMFVNAMTYIIIGVILFLLVWRYRHELVKGWNGWKIYVVGIVTAVILMAFSILYSYLINLGYETDGNNNQTTLDSLIEVYPFFSIVIFGLIGPFVEEITYRVGLFSLMRRINTWVAYLVTIIIFTIIHFDWNLFFMDATRDDWINEAINLPSYVVAAFGFSFIYEKWGFGASYLAHMFNNVISVIFILTLYTI